MRITLIATGKAKKGATQNLCNTYQKRLQTYWPTAVIEIPQSKADTVAQIKQKEATAQLAKTPKNNLIIALDEHGKTLTTRQFSQQLETYKNQSANLTFILGGAEGLDESVLKKATLTLSLSPLTFPHQLARVLILEQLYRCATLLAGHPYHRD